jgi:hypothetical protein
MICLTTSLFYRAGHERAHRRAGREEGSNQVARRLLYHQQEQPSGTIPDYLERQSTGFQQHFGDMKSYGILKPSQKVH